MQDPTERLALHLRRLRLRHFEVLLAVARHGSLTATAQALDSAQPAVSQWLAEIEAAVGVPLFVRGRQIKPTAALAPVLRHARRVVADSQHLARELDAVADGALGPVRVWAAWSWPTPNCCRTRCCACRTMARRCACRWWRTSHRRCGSASSSARWT